MATPKHRNDGQVGIEQEVMSDTTQPTEPAVRELGREAWEQTDRPLIFPSRNEIPRPSQEVTSAQVARKRWLAENGVQTEFLDGGIGCCWFARQGDLEPVSGQTEEEAIARLARERGLVEPEA